MGITSAARRRAGWLYRRHIEPSVVSLLRSRPRLELACIPSFEEYRNHTARMVELNGHRRALERGLISGDTSFETPGFCAVCEVWTRFVTNFDYGWEVDGRRWPNWREQMACPSCNLNNRMRASVQILREQLRPVPEAAIYMTERTTRLFGRVAGQYANVVGSEFLGDGTPRGRTNAAGIRCEDLTGLTFADGRFDYVLCFEVFEHVPDYARAFRECARILRPSGRLLMTVPFHKGEHNTLRARIGPDGEVEHLLPPEYHGDPLKSEGTLCFQYFGWEMLDQLRRAGFKDAAAYLYWSRELGYLGDGEQVQFIAVR
jgi:hypothetical protein